MNDYTVRLQQITLKNFKNVKNGKIAFQSYIEKTKKKKKDKVDLLSRKQDISNRADLIGIYGQNGSGKTAIVDSLRLFIQVVSGKEISSYNKSLIMSGENCARCEYVFYIKENNVENASEYIVYYGFEITHGVFIDKSKPQMAIVDEYIKYSKFENGKIGPKVNVINYNINLESIISPQKRINELKKNKSFNKNDLVIFKELTNINSTSFLFNYRSFNSFVNGIEESRMPLEALYKYAMDNLIIIGNDRLRDVKDISEPIPFSLIVYTEIDKIQKEYIVRYDKPILVNEKDYNSVQLSIKRINSVLKGLIPGLQIEANKITSITMSDGDNGYSFELLSVKGKSRIPLVCESDGIKKIISILSAMIVMRHDEKVCLVVDELDAGVYEYLLGELLSVLEDNAKGQFIFTSHNLRALETLSKESIVFTTTNPENRYIRLTYVNGTNNIRDFYIRSIVLGGQVEELFFETNRYDIMYGFIEAWGEDNGN